MSHMISLDSIKGFAYFSVIGELDLFAFDCFFLHYL